MLWPKNPNSLATPDLKWIEDFAHSLPNDSSLLCLDIEHWHLHSIDTKQLDKHIEYLSSILRTIRKIRPNLIIGYYGIMPIRNYHAPVKSDPIKLKKWKKDNRNLQILADQVDVIFPSLYTFYKDQKNWVVYAEANILEAKKYGKPVIPFIWPQYHGSNKLFKYRFVDKHYWKLQLDTIYKHADGVAIWSPWGNYKSEWDPDADWWKATLEFIKKDLITRPPTALSLDS